MNESTIREQLHEYIEHADSQHLAAMYVLLQKELPQQHTYDSDTLAMLYRRLEEDLKGASKTYTVTEAMAAVRSSKRK